MGNSAFLTVLESILSDHVFVVDRENSRIQEFDTNGKFINKWYGVSAKDKFKRPEDITFSPFGIFITDTGNNRY